MLLTILSMLGGFLLLILGAEGVVRGGASTALRFGLTPLIVGLTIVSFGTSSPELVVSLEAALSGSGVIAVGNVIGSNISNIGLILGITALISPMQVQAQLIRLDVPILIASTLLVIFMLSDGVLSRLEGGILFIALIVYLAFSIRIARRGNKEFQDALTDITPPEPRSLGRDLAFILGGLVCLTIGASLFVGGAVQAAEVLGISKAVIGLTVVALGTSLPELATSVVAALKGEGDIAIGNVVGSNLFNLLAILGITALVLPLDAADISWTSMGLLIGFTLLLLPLMRTGFKLSRWEGALLLVLYVSYVVLILR